MDPFLSRNQQTDTRTRHVTHPRTIADTSSPHSTCQHENESKNSGVPSDSYVRRCFSNTSNFVPPTPLCVEAGGGGTNLVHARATRTFCKRQWYFRKIPQRELLQNLEWCWRPELAERGFWCWCGSSTC